MILFRQMILFVIMMAIGYGMAQKRIWTEDTSKAVSWFIVNVANPALILSGSVGNTIEPAELFHILILSVVMYLLLILMAELIVPLFRFTDRESAVYKVLLVFTNMGFMGFPIMSAMYGAKSLLYAAVFMLPFDFLIYTYGVYRMVGGVEHPRMILKKCCNAGVIAVFATLIIALCGIELPYIATETISMLSDLTAPLSMIVIGASFAGVAFREAFGDWKLLLFSFVRLIAVPVMLMLLFSTITDNVLLQQVAFIVVATPSASMVAMLSQQYGGDYLTAAKGVAVTTLLSVVTMPLLFAVFQMSY